jgi:hypothetical protein
LDSERMSAVLRGDVTEPVEEEDVPEVVVSSR